MRKEYYLKSIREAVKLISSMQDSKGSFCTPFNEGIVKIPNARWQEAVLTLAWAENKGIGNYCGRVEKGIEYWRKLQNSNGSFPEIYDKSYAATAFSSIAIAQALKLLEKKLEKGVVEKAIGTLKKTKEYLTKHSNTCKTNQEVAALKALCEMKDFFSVSEEEIEKKKKNVFSNMTPSGFFKEDDGIDLGYSSLSWEMLESIGFMKESEEFVETLSHFIFPDGTLSANFSRSTGWIVLDQLEMLAESSQVAERILNLYIQADLNGLHSARHFLDERHLMTDAYRLCWAFDNCGKEGKPRARMPFEDADWIKEFPEKILVIRKPQHMSVFYFQNKFSQSTWFEKGLVANLSTNVGGNTVIRKYFTVESPESIEWKLENNLLSVKGTCRPNFFDKGKAGKGIGRAVNALKKEKFEKSFEFKNNEISINVMASKGVEKVPVLGSLKIKGFEEKRAGQEHNVVFLERKDFKVWEKEFEKELNYEIGE